MTKSTSDHARTKGTAQARNGPITLRTMVPIAASLLFVNGCANLSAINTASGQLVSASSAWNSVADGIQTSCHRRNQVSEVSSDCLAEQNATTTLESVDKILTAYFSALQQASDTKNFSVDPGISSLAKSVQAIPGANQDQVQAVSGLAQFLVDAATSALRERTLNRLINDGAPDAEKTIDVLNSVVVKNLNDILDDESRQTLATFGSYIQQSGSRSDLEHVNCTDGPNSREFATGTAFMLAQAYCARMSTIKQQRDAIKNYQNSLAMSKATLEALQSGKDNLSAGELARQLLSQAASLNGEVDKIEKAF